METYPSLKKILFLMLIFSHSLSADNYVIYSIAQEIPMGFKNEKIQKNFYINMGSKQGLRKGTHLNIYRKMSKIDPFDNTKKYWHKIKIGTLEVVHVEENSAVSLLKSMEKKTEKLVLDIASPIIGDLVDVSLD